MKPLNTFVPAIGEKAAATAREWLAAESLFLDTETTGIGNADQVCQLAVLDVDGRTLLDALIFPEVPVGPEALAIHGLSAETLRFALPMAALVEPLTTLLRHRQVVVWNADFDDRLLCQSGAGEAAGLAEWRCAMKLQAEWYGEWNEYHGNYRWQRLENAARQCGLRPIGFHSALADAATCRLILKAIADQ